MTNELEKQFFQCFGIEPKELEYPDNFTYYPKITERKLLELICIIQQLKDIDYLKEFILKYIINLYKTNYKSVSNTDKYQTIAKDIKQQVRTLFEEI